MRSDDEVVAALAARLAARAGHQGIKALLRAMRRKPRAGTLRALSEIESREVSAAMQRWVRRGEGAVRLVAAEWLARRGDELAVAALREYLAESVPPNERDRAAVALVEAKDVTSVPRLVELARRGRLGKRAITALLRQAGRLGWQESGPLVVEVLWRGVAHPELLWHRDDAEIWVAAVDAAPSVGPLWSAQTEALAGPISPGCPYRSALVALKREGVGSFLVATWALPLASELRRHAVSAFARLEGKASAGRLIELLESPLFERVALAALIEQGASAALRDGLRHPSAVVRACCASGLGALADPASLPFLRSLLDDRDPFVRMEAAHALATITGEAVFYEDHHGEQRLATP